MTLYAIILAAGKGSRLCETFPTTDNYITKSLVLIDGETSLQRLIRQLRSLNYLPIVVSGHNSEYVQAHCNQLDVDCLVNNNYGQDTNSYSLFLAFNYLNKFGITFSDSFLVVEADSILTSKASIELDSYISSIGAEFYKTSSVIWSSTGPSNIDSTGGFLSNDGITHSFSSRDFHHTNVSILKSPPKYSFKLFGISLFSYKALVEWLFLFDSLHCIFYPYYHQLIIDNPLKFNQYFFSLNSTVFAFNIFSDLFHAREYLSTNPDS